MTLEAIHPILKPLLASTKGVMKVKDMSLIMLNIIEESDNFIPIIVVILCLLINRRLNKMYLGSWESKGGGKSTCPGEPPSD